jgi:hypothetical protein
MNFRTYWKKIVSDTLLIETDSCTSVLGFFNEQYVKHNLLPNYGKIAIPETSSAAKCTQNKAQIKRNKRMK